MNTTETKRSVGRPAAEIKYPRGVFTLNDLYEMNHTPKKSLGRGKKAVPAKICKLTLIKHISARLEDKSLTLLPETAKTGKVGKPAYRYILTSVQERLEKARQAKGGTPTEAPVAVSPTVDIPLTVSVPDPAPAPVNETVTAVLDAFARA